MGTRDKVYKEENSRQIGEQGRYVEEDESRRICNKLQVICWYCVKSLRLEVARV